MSGFASAQAAYEAPPDDGDGLWVQCEDCAGTGTVECDECDGTGANVACTVCVCGPPSGTATCETCEGETILKCEDCKGEGLLYGPDLRDWCDACGLSGRCRDCDPPERDYGDE